MCRKQDIYYKSYLEYKTGQCDNLILSSFIYRIISDLVILQIKDDKTMFILFSISFEQ